MRIVLDTSVIVSDYSMSGVGFEVLLGGMPRVAASLNIPRVVFEEVVNKYSEAVEERWTAVDSALRAAHRILPQEIGTLAPREELSSAVETYRATLKTRLLEHGSIDADYPNVGHQELVSRALQRRKPFSKKGAGYRDSLIWEAVLRCAKDTGDDTAYVSLNTSDFADANLRLHPDLQADVEARGLRADQVRFFPSLQALNNTLIVPALEKLDAVRDKLNQGSNSQFDLRAWLHKSLEELLDGEQVKWVCHDLPPGCGRLSVSEHTIVDVDVDDVRLVRPHSLLIRCDASLKLSTRVSLSSNDYDNHKEARDLGRCGLGWRRLVGCRPRIGRGFSWSEA